MALSFHALLRRKPLAAPSEIPDRVGERPALSRSLNVLDLVSLGIAAIVGAGIFSTVGGAAANGGPAVILLFILTGIACGFAALCYAEFASILPVAGSAYTYAYVAFGEFIAWVIGWDLLMEYAIGNITVAISWSDYFTSFLTQYGIKIPAYLQLDYSTAAANFTEINGLLQSGTPLSALQSKPELVSEMLGYQAWIGAPIAGGMRLIGDLPAFIISILVTVLAFIGIRQSKRAANGMVVLKLLVIALVIVVGASYVVPAHWVPFAPNGMKGVLRGTSAVFFAYIGFDAISTTAEECIEPQRDLPRGMLGALLVSTILYVLIALVLTGMVDYHALGVGDPLAFVFGPHGVDIPWISSVVGFSAIVAMTSVLLVYQLGQPRIWMAMSRDGLLPPLFSAIHPRFKTPWFSTIVAGAVVAIPSLFLDLPAVTDLTSIGTLSAFLIVSAGILVLDLRHPEFPRRFRVPFVSSRLILPVLVAAGGILLIREPSLMTDLFPLQSTDRLENAFEYLLAFGFLAATAGLAVFSLVRPLSLIPSLSVILCGYLLTQLSAASWIRFMSWFAVGLLFYLTYGVRRSHLAARPMDPL